MRTGDPYIQQLFEKYIQGIISEKEMEEMLAYFKTHGVPEDIDGILMEEMQQVIRDDDTLGQLTGRVEDRLRARLQVRQQTSWIKPIRTWIPYAAAVVIAGVLLWGVDRFYLTNPIGDMVAESATLSEEEISPAGNRASLVLSDGRVIALDEDEQGIVLDGQRITYQGGNSTLLDLGSQSPVESITLSTPRGGTYKMTLPDGTLVWLNAGSTLTYPSRFAEDERIVHLDGEAYFSVKQQQGSNGLMPFKVVSTQQTIDVLGTEFNVSAYADETETRTTLVEGRVSIRSAGQLEDLILLPGEQSLVQVNHLSKFRVDVRDYTDWKNGEFVFRNESAPQVLRRIARWYDVDLEYSGDGSFDEKYSGTISRYGELQTVLDIMAEAGSLRFAIQDRTVEVYKERRKQPIR